MQTHIFAEGSNTTAESRNKPIKDYYKGLFSIVRGLYEELSKISETHLYIFSEEYGVARGDEIVATVYENNQCPVGGDGMATKARSELMDVASNADVMVILLSTAVFEDIVAPIWDDLVKIAQPESIWCLGVAQSCLKGIDFEKLEKKDCTVLTYQRVGVAQIGSETRDELLEIVKQTSVQ
jgi:hypothetical protein